MRTIITRYWPENKNVHVDKIQLSEHTLFMMDSAIENFVNGKVSEAVDLSKFSISYLNL